MSKVESGFEEAIDDNFLHTDSLPVFATSEVTAAVVRRGRNVLRLIDAESAEGLGHPWDKSRAGNGQTYLDKTLADLEDRQLLLYNPDEHPTIVPGRE